MSAINKFLQKIRNLEKRAKYMEGHHVRVGWVDGDTEPAEGGKPGASLAQVAKTLNYGRAGGKSKKDGHEYGAIPARNFVDVFENNFIKPVSRIASKQLLDFEKGKETVDLAPVGFIAQEQLKKAMKASNEYAPNSPFTVKGGWMTNPITGKPFYAKGKKSARPLWDKGTLIYSVTFEIKER
jgi:hypothetical protein